MAGADPGVAARLGLSMTALQASIGSLNDILDVEADRGRKPAKPIPAGLVSPRVARATAIVAALVGCALALASGGASVALAVIVLAVGYGYDRFAKGTAWSWLPFAIGIPLLPVYGWFGATGALAPWFAPLLPTAAAAGGAIALANARTDLERDADAGITTVATALGARRSWMAMATLWAVAAAVALGSLAVAGRTLVDATWVLLGLTLVGLGVAVGRDGGPARRQRSWEVQAVGAGLTAVAWILAIA